MKSPGSSPVERHPGGMSSLAIIEFCERMSYYGMAALLVLYMTATRQDGGLAYAESKAKMLYSLYTGAVYLLPLLGGFVADRLLGARKTMVVGAVVVTVGHVLVAFQSELMFFSGLAFIALGTGLLKPNVNALLGTMYAPNSPLRQAGFLLMYMAINLGAFFAPLVCGFMAGSPTFKSWLSYIGIHAEHTWHYGFASAGVMMALSLLWCYLHRDRLAPYGALVKAPPKVAGTTTAGGLTGDEWKKLGALGFLFVSFALYCGVSQQSGTTLTLFAKSQTDLNVGGWKLEPSYTLALNPMFIVLLVIGPMITAGIWRRFKLPTSIKLAGKSLALPKTQMSDPMKFACGMVWLSLGSVLMVFAARDAGSGHLASPLWLVGIYFFQTVAEILMSPVGNNAATRLAPARYGSFTTGVWYTSVALGSVLAGWLSGWTDSNDPASFGTLFGYMAVGSGVLAVIIFAMSPFITRLMGESDSSKPSGGSH